MKGTLIYFLVSAFFILLGMGMVVLTMDGSCPISSGGKWLILMIALLGLTVTTSFYLTSCFYMRKQLGWKGIVAMLLIVAVNLLVMCFYGASLLVLQLLF